MGKILAFVCCLGLGLTVAPVRADDAEDKAVAAIKKICASAACLGGECGLFIRDEMAAGKLVIGVHLSIATGWRGAGETDAGMKGLKELKSLQTLVLTYTQVTDAGLKELKELTNLRSADIGSNKITAAGIRELHAALPKLEILGVDVPAQMPDDDDAKAAEANAALILSKGQQR
jgi:hypothetical protein